MTVHPINQLVAIEVDPEHVWGMALHGFMQATQNISELAKAQPYRDFALDDFTKIIEATLAVNLMCRQLQTGMRAELQAAE